jgi:hypothetical protein
MSRNSARATSCSARSRAHSSTESAAAAKCGRHSCGALAAYARARNLMQRGLTEERAWRSACNQRGPWWNAGASHMNAAFPKSWFDTQGLVSLLGTVQRLQRAS